MARLVTFPFDRSVARNNVEYSICDMITSETSASQEHRPHTTIRCQRPPGLWETRRPEDYKWHYHGFMQAVGCRIECLYSGIFIHGLARLTLILFIKGKYSGYGIRWHRGTASAARSKRVNRDAGVSRVDVVLHRHFERRERKVNAGP